MASRTPIDQVKKRSDGLARLLVDMRAAVGHGLTIRPIRTMMNHATTELFFDDLQVPADPKTTFAVGRIGGGTSVNAIPFESWMEVDMRSVDAAALQALESGFLKAVDAALTAENARWNQNGRLTVEKQLVGDRPAGLTPASSPIVEAAVSGAKERRRPPTRVWPNL